VARDAVNPGFAGGHGEGGNAWLPAGGTVLALSPRAITDSGRTWVVRHAPLAGPAP
jgi:hypothetical protein